MRISLEDMEKRLDRQESREQGQQINYAQKFMMPKGITKKNVKILIDDVRKVFTYRTHRVQRISKKGTQYWQDVNCIGEGCPLCEYAAKTDGKKGISRAHDTIVIPMLDLDYGETPTVTYWVRSSGFYRSILVPFVAHFHEGLNGFIEINKAGSGQGTVYNLYPTNEKMKIELKSNEEYIKEYNVNIEEDLKSIIYDYSLEKLQQLIPADEPIQTRPTERPKFSF